MSELTSINIKDLSGGSLYRNFLSQLPEFDAAIGYYDPYVPARLNEVLAEMKKFLNDHPSDKNLRKRVYSMARLTGSPT